MRIARWWMAALLVASCADELAATTDGPCAHGERSFELYSSPTSYVDALIVVDRALGDRIEPRIASLIEALATSNVDDDPDRDVFRNHELRIAILTAAEANGVLRSPEQPVPFARYQYAPHGYGHDVADFVERVLCRRTRDAAACASSPLERIESELIEGEQPFASAGHTELYVISDRDACAAGELPGTSDRDCDADLHQLLATVRDDADRGHYSRLSIIAGVPLALGSLAGTQHIMDGNGSPAHILDDPQFRDAASDSDVCAGATDVSARPAPELLRLGATGRVLSVCAPSYREITAMNDCPVADRLPQLVDEFERRDDGTYACELRETLPASGLITRCQQLADFGRYAAALAVDGNREICVVQQVTEAEAEAGEVFGWYVPTSSDYGYTWRGGDAKPWCVDLDSRATTAHQPAFTANTEQIAGSQLHMTCTLKHGPELASCESL